MAKSGNAHDGEGEFVVATLALRQGWPVICGRGGVVGGAQFEMEKKSIHDKRYLDRRRWTR